MLYKTMHVLYKLTSIYKTHDEPSENTGRHNTSSLANYSVLYRNTHTAADTYCFCPRKLLPSILLSQAKWRCLKKTTYKNRMTSAHPLILLMS